VIFHGQIAMDTPASEVEEVASSTAASPPETAMAVLIGLILIGITLWLLRSLSARLWGTTTPLPRSCFTIGDVILVFGLLILGQSLLALLLQGFNPEGDPPWVLIASGIGVLNLLLTVLIVTLHRYRCQLGDIDDAMPLALRSALPTTIISSALILLAYLPANFGVAILWTQLMEALAIDFSYQKGILELSKAFEEKQFEVLVPLILLASVIAPISEEILFRGLLFRYLRSAMGVTPAIICSAALFTVMHDSITSWGPLMALGSILAWTYHRSGHLWVPIFIHAIFNSTMMILVMLGDI